MSKFERYEFEQRKKAEAGGQALVGIVVLTVMAVLGAASAAFLILVTR